MSERLDERMALTLLGLGFSALAVPTIWRLAHTVWITDEQGHGPLVLAVSAALLFKRWPAAGPSTSGPALHAGQLGPPSGAHPRPASAARMPIRGPWLALGLLALSLPLYALGRSQAILMAEVGALIVVLWSLILLQLGLDGLRRLLFALFFLLFMVPLPEALVASLTAPMKTAVSTVAAWVLQAAGQPVARSGVMLTAGPYQLLVADACAGLTTLFTLEALGLLYLNLRGHAAWWRNAAMAVMVVPISFTANVLRVITLVLVTLFWGDAAGQGFAHGFAGVTLFVAALLLLMAVDALLALFASAFRRTGHSPEAPVMPQA